MIVDKIIASEIGTICIDFNGGTHILIKDFMLDPDKTIFRWERIFESSEEYKKLKMKVKNEGR